MKRFGELYTVVIAAASTIFVPMLLIGVTVSYAQQATSRPASEVYPLAMACFGVTAALAGVCFTMAPHPDQFGPVRYAGEKFLHSSLLLIQSLLALFVRDHLLDSQWALSHPAAAAVGAAILGTAVWLILAAGAFCWNWGFESLNDEMWKGWRNRLAKAPTTHGVSTPTSKAGTGTGSAA